MAASVAVHAVLGGGLFWLALRTMALDPAPPGAALAQPPWPAPSAVVLDLPTVGDGVLLEDRLLTCVRIVSELVALVWLLDIASHGQLAYKAKYRWAQLRAKVEQEKQIRRAARHALFEATRIVESA